MPNQIVLRPTSVKRRQPLLNNHAANSKARLAEVAGGTAAECAVVCCCCPCGIVNLIILAVYKLPAGICRRALRKKRRQRQTKKGVLPQHRCSCGCDETELQINRVVSDELSVKSEVSEKEIIELEKEMWNRFYGTGFWRSPSQREYWSRTLINSKRKVISQYFLMFNAYRLLFLFFFFCFFSSFFYFFSSSCFLPFILFFFFIILFFFPFGELVK